MFSSNFERICKVIILGYFYWIIYVFFKDKWNFIVVNYELIVYDVIMNILKVDFSFVKNFFFELICKGNMFELIEIINLNFE